MALVPTYQYAQNAFDQTQIINQDVRWNAVQAYIKYKAHYDKKANTSTLKEADYAYVLQPQADHQGSKFRFMQFRWIGQYLFEKMLPINIYFGRIIGTNKTQVLHRKRMRQFTHRQPLPDIRITPQK